MKGAAVVAALALVALAGILYNTLQLQDLAASLQIEIAPRLQVDPDMSQTLTTTFTCKKGGVSVTETVSTTYDPTTTSVTTASTLHDAAVAARKATCDGGGPTGQ